MLAVRRLPPPPYPALLRGSGVLVQLVGSVYRQSGICRREGDALSQAVIDAKDSETGCTVHQVRGGGGCLGALFTVRTGCFTV